MPRRCGAGAAFALVAGCGWTFGSVCGFDFGAAGNAGEDGRVLRSEASRDVSAADGGPGSRAKDGDGATMAKAKAAAKAGRAARRWGVRKRGFIVSLQ